MSVAACRMPLSLAAFLLLATGPASVGASGFENEGPAPEPDPVFVRLMETKIADPLLSRLDSSGVVPIIISLANQPTFDIAMEVQASYWDDLRANEERIRAINRKYVTNRRPRSQKEAARFAREESEAVTPEDRQEIRRINEQSRELKSQMRREIMERARQAVAGDQSVIVELVRSLGGSVSYTYEIENAVAALVPGTAIRSIANHPLVRWVEDDQRMPAHLDVSAPAVMAATFWNAGETGGVWWSAICDSGVDTSHPALSGKTWWQGVFHATASTDPGAGYNDNSSSTDDLQGHGTHVAGIASSADATYRGIAYGSTRSTNLKAGYRGTDGRAWMYFSDGMASVNWGITNASMDAINLSYGGNTTSDDEGYVRFWDAVVDAKNTIVTISAGNSGPGEKTLGMPSINWNGMCVANVYDNGTINRADDVIWGSSSRGPTPAGRKKPDIAAPGTSINSTSRSWEGANDDFVSMTGTSMAAPHVVGAATLLHDVGIHNPRTIKAVLINTADFIGGATSWTKEYGWGYLNLNNAYLRRADWFYTSVKPRGTSGWYKLYKVPNPAAGDKATLVWNRHVNWNGANYPTAWYGLNDLDLQLYRESNNTLHSSSTSTIDNVEQVVSNTTEALVVRAYAWSTSFNAVSDEYFALATPPGTVAASGPILGPNSASSSYTPPLNAKFLVYVRLTNSGDLSAHNCTLSISLPAGITLVLGSTFYNLGTIAAGSSSDWIELWLKATTSGTKTIDLSATSSSYGITDWSGSGSFTVTPGPQDFVAPYSTLRIGQPTYQTGGTEKAANGGFESDLAGWVTSGAAGIETGSAYAGSKNLKLGPGTGGAYQTISISGSASRAFLSFWYRASASIFASAGCSITDSSGNTLVYPFYAYFSQAAWTKETIDISRFRGQTIRVNFYSSTGFFGSNSTMWVDEVGVGENEQVYLDSTNQLTISSRDDNAGVDYSQYHFNSDPYTTYSAAFTMSGQDEGSSFLDYRSVDNGGNVEPAITTLLYLDSEAPRSVLEVSGASSVIGGTEKATNGGFESNFAGWTTSGAASIVASPVHSGTKAAMVGGTGAGYIFQNIPVGAGASRAILSFWYKSEPGDTGYTALYVQQVASRLNSYAVGWNASLGWNQYVFDVTRFKGGSVRLRAEVFYTSGAAARLHIDDVKLLEDSTLHVLPSASFSIYSAERCGVQRYESQIDAGAWTEGQSFTIAGPGLHTVRYRATDNLNHQESDVVTQVNVDSAGPVGSVKVNNGAMYTTSTSVTLNISASDAAGVALMRIRNSTDAYGPWEPYSAVRAWTLTPGAGTKTVYIEFQDTLGNTSGEYSDSIQYLIPSTVETIGRAKLLGPHPVAVLLKEEVITGVFANQQFIYIEEVDRSSGIKVNCEVIGAGGVEGLRVSVEGVLHLNADNEIELYATDLGRGDEGRPLAAVGLNNRATLGGPFGSYVPGIAGGVGLHSTGLLVRAWGQVIWRSPEGDMMRIDDGPGIFGAGLLVDTTLYGPAPGPGRWVAVTGNLGTTLINAQTQPILRVRKPSDIQVY